MKSWLMNAALGAIAILGAHLSAPLNALADGTPKPCDAAETNWAVGNACITSKGFVFTRMQSGWKDEDTSTTWDIRLKSGVNWSEANAYCKSLAESLPEMHWSGGVTSFNTAEKHGIREVINLRGRWYWSESGTFNSPNDPPVYAWQFSGTYGDIGNGFPSDNSETQSAFCISR